ncbi:MAG: glycoside hydrolase family 2 TIM barrel-domain containing protein [Anaerolineales bacterium]|jgi:beta-galactosidase
MMEKLNFNRDWTFYKDGHEETFRTIDLPHDAMMSEARDPACKNGMNTGYFPGGKYWYVKTFEVPKEYEKKQVVFEFEGVYRNTEVNINGEKAAYRPYGYTNFFVPARQYLKPGAQNVIKVFVDNSDEPNSRWYTGSGIYRPVSMYILDPLHIDLNGVKVRTLSYSPAQIEVKESVVNGLDENKEFEITTEVLFGAKVVAGNKQKASAHANGKAGIVLPLEIPNAHLWNEAHPDLYQCRVRLSSGDEIVQEFGIRLIEWDSKKGFRINGETVKLAGACIHHDNGLLGACGFPTAEERRIRILKEQGFNAIRSSHNPCSRATLDACDRYGMYVMDEYADMWFTPKTKYDYSRVQADWWEQDIIDMVDKDYNHPSVVMYSSGNEVSETALPRGVEISRKYADKFHELDTTRPVTCGINFMLNYLVSKGMGIYKESGDSITDQKSSPAKTDGKKPGKKKDETQLSGSAFINNLMNSLDKVMGIMATMPGADKVTKDAFAMLDIAGYNYAALRYARDGKKYPGRVIVGSETFIKTMAYNWNLVETLPHVIGDFVWAGWDYLGEAGLGAWNFGKTGNSYPGLVAGCGTIDLTGFVTPQQAYLKTVWNRETAPYVCVRPVNHTREAHSPSTWRLTDALESWTWNGCEGKLAEVEVFSAAPMVELWVNGRSIGKKKCGAKKAYKARFKTVYQPGELTAVSYDKSGREMGRKRLLTAGDEDVLTVKAEQTRLRANGEDLAYINIAITDRNGNIKVLRDDKVTVEVDGAGTLAVLGSSAGRTEEMYRQTTHSMFEGRALAIVRASYQAGKVTVKISADGFKSEEVEISVK